MRWVALFLVVLIAFPRPVSGFEASRDKAPCSCSCCHDHSDCGCQGTVTPSPQNFADVPPHIVWVAVPQSSDHLKTADFLYSQEFLKDIFHPPPEIV